MATATKLVRFDTHIRRDRFAEKIGERGFRERVVAVRHRGQPPIPKIDSARGARCGTATFSSVMRP